VTTGLVCDTDSHHAPRALASLSGFSMRAVLPFVSGYQADGLINETMNVMVNRILSRAIKGPQEAYRAR
jgi:hypothetical protein